jgi:molybdate transport system substrate-binding protein
MRIVSGLFLAALAGCESHAAARPVTVYAAASLRELVTQVAAEWSRKSGRPHRLQIESTATLARQINEGAPADLFITAAPEWLDGIKPLERFDWLSNRLVCVVPKDDKAFDLKRLESLAMADEQAPAGKYARQALAREGIAIPKRTIYGHNVRDVLSKVTQGGAKVGIVYATDARLDPNVRVAHTFPSDRHEKILYSVGLLKPQGKALFEALKESWVIQAARNLGFVDPAN